MPATKTFPVEIVKAASDEYDAQFVLSASSADRVNDTIDPDAYKPYLGKRLIALWQHKSDNPFGYWENLRIKGQNLIGDLKVAGTNLGAMIKQLLADNVPLGASIGFAPKEYTLNEDTGGLHFIEIELLEVSVVSVPAHPLATRIKSILESESESLPDDDDLAASGRDVDPEAVIRKAKAAILAANKTIRGKQ